jgi:hypothetical protein
MGEGQFVCPLGKGIPGAAAAAEELVNVEVSTQAVRIALSLH